MYEAIKSVLLDLFKAPGEPPQTPGVKYDKVQTFRASPKFLQYQFLFLGISMVVLAIIISIGSVILIYNMFQIGLLIGFLLLILWILIFIAGYFMIRLEYDMRYYIVTDRSLRIRKGVWNILEQTLTFANVQNIQIEQGPLERLFGISNLVVETAGGGSSVSQEQGGWSRNYHRAVMRGLDNAESMRDLIMGYLKHQSKFSGLGDPDDRFNLEMKTKKQVQQQEVDAAKEILIEIKQLRQTLVQSS